MKIYRLGNDYAFQRRQKSAKKNQSVKPLAEQKANVENQISGLGERDLGTEETRQEKEVRKKKKETGSQAQQENGQV